MDNLVKFETNRLFCVVDLVRSYGNFIYEIFPETDNLISGITKIQNDVVFMNYSSYVILDHNLQDVRSFFFGSKLDANVSMLIGALNNIFEYVKKFIEAGVGSYKARVDEKISEINKLKEKIKNLEIEKIKLEESSQYDKSENEKIISEYNEQLRILEEEKKELIAREKEEKEKQKKEQDQIRNDWNINIENAFEALNKGTQSISDEYKRVQDTFCLYKSWLKIDIFSLCIYVLFLIYFCINNKPKEYIEFIPYHLPLFFFATIIWLCVSQMNKAQRQLIAFSDKIYRIKYLEGSLKGLNNVEQDKNILSQRVIEVLNNIINKHVNDSFKEMAEKSIEREEKKDKNEFDDLPKLVKKIMEIVTK